MILGRSVNSLDFTPAPGKEYPDRILLTFTLLQAGVLNPGFSVPQQLG